MGASLFFSLASWAAPAQIRFDLPAQSLAQALTSVGNLANLNIYFDPALVDGHMAPALKAYLSADEALSRLLAGTRLHAVRVDENTVRVVADLSQPQNAQTSRPPDTGAVSRPSQARLADVRTGVDVPPGQEGTQASQESQSQRRPRSAAATPAMTQVVVSAQKRAEKLQDVPMSLSALTGDQLEASRSYRLEDFVAKVPGVTLIQDGALGSQVVIRGMTTGVQAINSSVATYIDETPYTVEGPFAGSFTASPNLDTFDMQRIEVLRGPQGTLYGANALGGILKYVTNRPDPGAFVSTVETGVSTVQNGGAGFDTHGMVNLPLFASSAVRFVGYDTYYPGFIDDSHRDLQDVNGSRIVGGRVSFLDKPLDALTVRLSAIYQDRSWNDYSDIDVAPQTLQPVYGELTKQSFISQPGHAVSQVYNAILDYEAELGSILSTTSYYSLKPRATINYSILNPTISSILGQPFGTALEYSEPVQAVTQELRVSSPDQQVLQWQAGGYFTNESANELEGFYPIDSATGQILTDYPTHIGAYYVPVHYREYAGFANLDYHFTPQLDVSVGGRYSHNDQSFTERAPGLLGGNADFTNTSSQGVLTYSGDLRWHMTPRVMLYGRIASGFVPGGPNDAVPGSSLRNAYSSSKTVNYEGGIKATALDGHFSAEVSAFDIDWHDIQLVAIINGLGTITNGGTAKSEGIEWSFTGVPLNGLALSLNGAYTDARLTQATPASVGGEPGNRLPAVPLWQTSASGEYKRTILSGYAGFFAVDWRYTGNRFSEFSSTVPRVVMPEFYSVDLRAGLEAERFTVDLYVKNVANKIAINYVQQESLVNFSPAYTATLYTPRTIGLALAAHF